MTARFSWRTQLEHLDGYLGPEPSKVLSDTLKRRSSLAPGGYPVFRVVHSAYVFERIGGEWTDWDENVAYDDRGKVSSLVDMNGNPMAPLNKPMRTVIEIRTIPKYVDLDTEGWILERWFPAHMAGSPEAHYSQVVPGTSIPLLGPYPERGFYVMLTGPFPAEPSISFLEDFIGYHKSITDEVMGRDVEAHIKKRVYDREQAEEKKRAKGIQDTVDRLTDASKSILLGGSLAAGRLRSRAAERMGIRTHVGN